MRYEVDAAGGARRTATVFYDMTDAPGEDAIDGLKVDRDGQPLRLRPGRHLDALARRRAASARCALPEDPHNLAWGDDDAPHALHHRADERLPHPPARSRASARREREDHHAQGPRAPATSSPTSSCPTRTATLHRLSELQGDDAMVLMLGRGEHCPRERQHQREMLRFHEWCAGRVHASSSRCCPNDLHDVYKLKISTGAHWTYLADTRPRGRSGRSTSTSTPTPTTTATVPHTRRARAGPRDRQGLRRLLVLGPALAVPAVGRPPASSSPA